jgi:hypothetical protein
MKLRPNKARDNGLTVQIDGHINTRETFSVSRSMEYFTVAELVRQSGHNQSNWPILILKELLDNNLDAREAPRVREGGIEQRMRDVERKVDREMEAFKPPASLPHKVAAEFRRDGELSWKDAIAALARHPE